MADIASYSQTKDILEKYSIFPSKRFGQNFLIDANIARKIVGAAEVKKDDVILEIGPGVGALTQLLAKSGAEVTIIEIDRKLIEALRDQFRNNGNVKILHKDALRFDIGELPEPPNKLIANLPYNIASPLLVSYIHNFEEIEVYIVMLQREVAERILAKPGGKDYGSLTIKLQLMCDIENVMTVSPNVFLPKPKVESKVIKLTRKKQSLNKDERQKFFKLISASFGNRRKTLINSLSTGLNMDKKELENVLIKTQIEGSKRAEQLDLPTYLKLFSTLNKYL